MMAGVALAFTERFGAGFYDATARWPGSPTKDAGGSITTPGTVVSRTCKVQIDDVTEAMRGEAGYSDKDMALIVLAATLTGTLDTDATITMAAGPFIGTSWRVASVRQDAAGIYWLCRGRSL